MIAARSSQLKLRVSTNTWIGRATIPRIFDPYTCAREAAAQRRKLTHVYARKKSSESSHLTFKLLISGSNSSARITILILGNPRQSSLCGTRAGFGASSGKFPALFLSALLWGNSPRVEIRRVRANCPEVCRFTVAPRYESRACSHRKQLCP